MGKSVKNVDFDRVTTIVEFDQVENAVVCSKKYYSDEHVAPIHSESVSYSLCTMPLSVALQMAAAYVQQVGLVDYESEGLTA